MLFSIFDMVTLSKVEFLRVSYIAKL